MGAGYLFQPDKLYNVDFDTGDKAIQCGRHVDIFKLWLMWKARVGICHLFSYPMYLDIQYNKFHFLFGCLFSNYSPINFFFFFFLM